MHHLGLGYNDIESMPWEYFNWFYERHAQHLIDLQEQQNQQQISLGK